MNNLERTVTTVKCISALTGVVGLLTGPLLLGLYLNNKYNYEVPGFAVSAMTYAFIITALNIYLDYAERKSWQ